MYCEISWSKGSCGSLVGVVGTSASEVAFGFEANGVTSCLRGVGDGEVCLVILRVLSLSAGSL